MKRSHLVIALLISCLVIFCSILWLRSGPHPVADVRISDTVATPVQGRNDAARVFLKLENDGGAKKIASVDSSDAASATLRNTEMDLPVTMPAAGSASFSADGVHVLLEGIEGELGDGRLLAVKLLTGEGGEIVTRARFSSDGSGKHAGHMAISDQSHMMVADQAMAHGSSKDGADNGMSMDNGSAHDPSLAISVSEHPGGGRWSVALDVENFHFDKGQVDGVHVPGRGHGHLYLNGLKLGRVFDTTAEFGAVPNGRYVVRVTLNTNDHRPYMADGKPVTATAILLVE